jgi:hypothetical protein
MAVDGNNLTFEKYLSLLRFRRIKILLKWPRLVEERGKTRARVPKKNALKFGIIY